MASLSPPQYYTHRWRYWYRQVFRRSFFCCHSLFSRRLRHFYSAKMFVRRHCAFLLRLHSLYNSLPSSRHLSSWNNCAKSKGKNIAFLAHKVTTMSDGANFTFGIVSYRQDDTSKLQDISSLLSGIMDNKKAYNERLNQQ